MTMTEQAEALNAMMAQLDIPPAEMAAWMGIAEREARALLSGREVFTREHAERLQNMPGVTEAMALEVWDLA